MRLGARGTSLHAFRGPVLGRVVDEIADELPRGDQIWRTSRSPANGALCGLAGVITELDLTSASDWPSTVPLIHSLDSTSHLERDDVVALHPSGYVRTLHRRSEHNALFATDRCNSLCLMCSQPPIETRDDGRVAELMRQLDLIADEPSELGFTGGEPTLLGAGFIDVIRHARDTLPRTALHVLSNARLFRYGAFARTLAEIGHPDLMVGVPLYADVDSIHDHVVQSRGAFDDTLLGLHNLGRQGVRVEVRVVLHRLTLPRLVPLVEFIYRNVTFASQVVLMGMEQIGYAARNLDSLWVDPLDYGVELRSATEYLAARGMRVRIYNHQLCTVPAEVRKYCTRSISDWKREYLPECDGCAVRSDCGGFFTSVTQRRPSRGIRALSQSVR